MFAAIPAAAESDEALAIRTASVSALTLSTLSGFPVVSTAWLTLPSLSASKNENSSDWVIVYLR